MDDESRNDQVYQVIFAGVPADGTDLATARENLQRQFGLPREKLELLFSGRSYSIRKDLSWKQAWRYQARMKALGAQCKIMPLDTVDGTHSGRSGRSCPGCRCLAVGDTCKQCGFDLHRYRMSMEARGFIDTPGGFIRDRRVGERRAGVDRRGEIRYEQGRRAGLDRRASQSGWDRV